MAIFAGMQTIKINIVHKSSNSLPAYETAGSAGVDLRENLTQSLTLKPFERNLTPTGLFIKLSDWYEAQNRKGRIFDSNKIEYF